MKHIQASLRTRITKHNNAKEKKLIKKGKEIPYRTEETLNMLDFVNWINHIACRKKIYKKMNWGLEKSIDSRSGQHSQARSLRIKFISTPKRLIK